MIFDKGTYYIGDPCYVIKGTEWLGLLASTDYFEAEDTKYRGYPIQAGSTAYGDGEYFDNEGNVYSVDSGMIGIVPLDAVSKNRRGDGGRVVTFDSPFEVDVNKGGVFYFGRIIIDTTEDEE